MSALAGIRIIDLSMGWAGPLAARHLADLGADVIKVESCERFDWWRSWEATPEWIADDGAEKSTAFNMVNRNKRNITLDLEHPEGRQLLLDLVAGANAVVENYSGGVLPKLNLSYEIFCEARQNIILLSMPPFGANGPWAPFRAYGSTVEQSSGLPHLNGFGDDPPTMQHVAYGDPVGGINGASALLVALRHQARTGEGQFVDLSQVEALFPLASHGILEYAATGNPPERRGNAHPERVPHGSYPCRGEDAWLVLDVTTDAQFEALKNACPELASFATADRCNHREDIDAILAAWTGGQDAHALMANLQADGIPAAATHTAGTLLDDPHLKARNYWQWLERPVVGRQPNPSAPYRLDDAPLEIGAPAPTLGQHNEEVLGGILGLDASDLARLAEMGIIGTKPRMPREKSPKTRDRKRDQERA